MSAPHTLSNPYSQMVVATPTIQLRHYLGYCEQAYWGSAKAGYTGLLCLTIMWSHDFWLRPHGL